MQVFRRAVVALIAAASAHGAAQAADLGVRGDASSDRPAALANWSGVFVGLDSGYDWSRSNWTFTNNSNTNTHAVDGGEAGFHLGVQRQLGHFVYGLEAGANWLQASGQSNCPNPTYQCRTEVRGLEALQARLGLADGSWLIYGTAGLAFEQVKHSTPNATTPANTESVALHTAHGWVLGAGMERKLTPQISLGAVAQHYVFDTEGNSLINDADGTTHAYTQFATRGQNVLQVRLTYQFDPLPDRHVPLK